MASTDTIVGIVGAVLLAGIMVGVFAYEYSNPPEDVTVDPKTAAIAAFNATHPLLDAMEDIDGDGLVNYNDTDLDNNGVNDTAQAGNLVVAKVFSDSTPAPPATSYTREFPAFFVGTGNQGLTGTLNWSVSTPLPQLPPVPNLTCQLLLNGQAVASCGGGTQSGSARSLTIEAMELEPGNYTMRVTMTSASPAGAPAPVTQYQLSAWISYGPANVEPVDTNPR